MNVNRDDAVISGFGDEWRRFNQSGASEAERAKLFEAYFAIFPWSALPPDARGADIGCGSGRWADFVAPKVGHLVCVDPSNEALGVARRNLMQHENVDFLLGDAEMMAIPNNSLDFAYSLGVLHHIPDTTAALSACVRRLKPGAPFLLYLYYAFDNRPPWFRLIWRISDYLRKIVSRRSLSVRYAISQILASVIYWPLARTSRILEKTGRNVANFPLTFYRDRSFYIMRNDALDRFGTQVEHRFTQDAIRQMMLHAGLTDITFSASEPYWCAVGYRS